MKTRFDHLDDDPTEDVRLDQIDRDPTEPDPPAVAYGTENHTVEGSRTLQAALVDDAAAIIEGVTEQRRVYWERKMREDMARATAIDLARNRREDRIRILQRVTIALVVVVLVLRIFLLFK